MSLDLAVWDSLASRFPRVSGDEPVAAEVMGTPLMFSPRERG